MKNTPLTLGAIAVFIALSAHGANKSFCSDLPDEINARDGRTCLEDEQKKLQSKEEQLYRYLVAAIPACATGPGSSPKEWHQALAKSEQAWREFVARDCSGDLIFNEWQGGTGGNQAVEACMVSRLKQRIKAFQDRSGYYRDCK